VKRCVMNPGSMQIRHTQRRLVALILVAASWTAMAQDEAAPAAPSATPPAAARPVASRPSAPIDPASIEPAINTSRPAAAARPVVDRLDLGTTSITGNQELPKVLTIVPWKRSDLGDLIGRPVNTLLDEVLAPIDPEVFERQLSYYETLHGNSKEE
jgi:hypothetical protein